MATYKSTRMQPGVQPVYNATGDITVVASYDISTGSALVNNDLIQVCQVPANATVTRTVVDIPSTGLDSSTGTTWVLGDTTTANKFITTSTVGQSAAGGIVGMNAAGGLSTAYTVNTTVQLKMTASASGTAVTTGKIYFAISYVCQLATV